MDMVLQTTQLTKIYSKRAVVDHVSMHVEQGAIYGFIGKNGAGKTTLMRMITGLAFPDQGSFQLFGGQPVEKARLRTGCIIETPALYPNLTARQNLEVWQRVQGQHQSKAIEQVLRSVSMVDTGSKKVKQFSMGMKQRLSIAMSLLGNPDFLILDEPINGLDPTGIMEVRDLIVKLNQEHGITFLISSHILGELSKIATHYGIIHEGKLVDEFSAQQLQERCKRCLKLEVDDSKQAAYLLESEFGITNYDVSEQGVLRIFDHLEEAGALNMKLAQSGIVVKSMNLSGQNLEEYFMDLMSGSQPVSSHTKEGN